MLSKLILTTILASVALTACVADVVDREQATDDATLVAQIRSADDLAAYLRNRSSSPLDRLSPAAKKRFLDGLVFSDGGLGGYRFTDLEAELTPSEIYEILSLFGAERTTPMIKGARIESEMDKTLMKMAPGGHDYPDNECKKRATCQYNPECICLAGC